ncbi:hypothetical protein GLOIN_2v1622527 [Rhizophagus irregularis DAOM 181602=DAOM 197198]|uniref:Uncharacterized protein n=1 Tax=Rhizophagus irregularis (strain DAOM 181602 / DAOM 197198 / MUCL 43194) TaxID=747089 RepID=A0A2P4PWS6_RHIID|nr:hypothetical protein GLOIN_2v1622527 [Rhizophagus irregularis DAOM 181602=DAOM 197198]POG69847.1 hypothetical protein GLOIN_2v1622527 [Rhizophagus irregularis DAOM 181602=DAOM 197198]|eukprot:XP_025176713.1 hypothetical protein GLOIN_2v1622527 [Rhizophagus irregularis DAOM 181602=DAOM 197198]
MSFFNWYKNHLFRRPILIQTITIYCFYRTLRLGGFGLCIAGPSTTIWVHLKRLVYIVIVGALFFKNPMLGLLTHVTLDQAIFAP